MDEPLSNLDAKLRVQMRTEVARLQSRLETTTVYVTHDQTEAMTLGDRVAVMRAGVLQQVGTPAELYDEPMNLFVAGFIGSPAMNFMPAELSGGKVKLPIGEVDAAGEPRRRRATARWSPACGRRASRTPTMVGDLQATSAASSSRPRSTWSSRSAPTSTPTSTSSPEGVESDQLADLVEERLEETGAAEIARGPGADRRPPRPGQQGQAPRHSRAMGRHLEAAPLRPGERRAARLEPNVTWLAGEAGPVPPRWLPSGSRQSACASRPFNREESTRLTPPQGQRSTATARAMNAACSAYTHPGTTSPASPTSASTRCSTAARSRPGSPPARAGMITTLRDSGLVSPGLRRGEAAGARGRHGDRPRPLLDHRRRLLGERAAGLARRRPRGGARPQRQPDQRGRALGASCASAGSSFRGTSDSEIIAALLSSHRPSKRIEDAVADDDAAAARAPTRRW